MSFTRHIDRYRKDTTCAWQSHFDAYGNDYIEIWEYKGDVRGSRICMVKEEGEVACYRRAIEELKTTRATESDRSNEKRAG